MQNSTSKLSFKIGAATLVFGLLAVAGCSKKSDNAAAPPAVAATPSAETPAPAPAAADAAAQTPTGPVLDSSQMVGDAKAAIAEADAAIRQKEYEKAVRTMLAIQQAQLNAQQAALAHQQMKEEKEKKKKKQRRRREKEMKKKKEEEKVGRREKEYG